MLNWKEHFITNANVNVAVLSAIKLYVTPVTMKNKTTKKRQYHEYKNCTYTIKNTWLRNGKKDGTTISIWKTCHKLVENQQVIDKCPIQWRRMGEKKKNVYNLNRVTYTYTCWLLIIEYSKLNSSMIKIMSYYRGIAKQSYLHN